MQYYILCLLFVLGRSYFGLEEVEVTIQTDQQVKFPGVITIVPHTESVILWYCTQEKRIDSNLLQIFSTTSLRQLSLLFVNDYKGIILQFSNYSKVSIDKNNLGMHQLTLLSKDKSHKLIISYKTQIDREYTNEVIELIHSNIGTSTQFIQDSMFGMEDYLDSFCKRNVDFPPLDQQYGDL